MDLYSSKLSPALDIGVGMYLFVVAVLSVTGNMLVLIMAYRRSTSMKPPELLSVNLAVTDLGAAISMYPLAAASAWNHRWLGGDATCVYYGLVGFFFGMASIMNLTIMAIVRFIVSVNLQSTRGRVSRRTVKLLCVWIWLYALTWALLPIVGWGKYGPEPFGLSCSLAWAWMKEDGFAFIVLIFVLNLALPSLVIFACYFGISFKLFYTYRNCSNGSHRLSNIVKMHRRLLIIAVLISAGFIICWSPYGMVSLWCVLRKGAPLPPVLTLLPCMFAKSSTVYNPIIYYTFSKRFKREVKHLGAMCGVSGGACRAADDVTDNRVYMVTGHTEHATVVGDAKLSDRSRHAGAAAAAAAAQVDSNGAWNAHEECEPRPRPAV